MQMPGRAAREDPRAFSGSFPHDGAALMNGGGAFTFAPKHRDRVRDLAMNKRTILFTLAAILSAEAASAHHGWGSHDASQAFTITAPVGTLSWADPHAPLMIDYQVAA